MMIIYDYQVLHRCVDKLCLTEDEAFKLTSRICHWFKSVTSYSQAYDVLGDEFKPLLAVSKITCPHEEIGIGNETDASLKEDIEFYLARRLLR